MKEQIKAPKIELSDEEITNLSDAEFKILVIRMLTEMVEYGHKIEEEVKATQSEIKENVQGTNNDGKETGTQSEIWGRRKKETLNQNRMKKQELKKKKEREYKKTLGHLQKYQYLNHRDTRRRRGRARN